jgi:hypothetical protein
VIILIPFALAVTVAFIAIWAWSIRDMWRRRLPWWQWFIWVPLLAVATVFGFALYMAFRDLNARNDSDNRLAP